MKILQVTDCYLPMMGGIEMQVSRLSDQLAKRGHDVLVLTATDPKLSRGLELPTKHPSVRSDETDEREPQVLRSVWKNPLGLPVDPNFHVRLRSVLDEEKPDAVHLNMGELSPGVMSALVALRGADIPVVVSVHSVWSKFPTLPLYRGLAALAGVTDADFRWAPVSQMVADRIRTVLPDANITVLPNAVETGDWRADPKPHEMLTAVSATRFAPRKRIPALLRILKQAGKQLGPDPKLKVVVAGDGPLLGFARKYVERNGMADWVLLPGRMTKTELVELYKRADIYLAPSIKDAFLISGVEAQTSGLAVLARSGSAFAQTITDGVQGAVAGSDRKMAQVLVDWVRHPQTVEAIKEHNRAEPPSYTWERVLPKIEKLYS